MLNLSNFRFCVVDFQFIYPKGSKKEDLDSLDPSFVKLNGFSVSDNDIISVCRIFDEFKNFGFDKKSLASKLCSQCVISGSGYISNDNSFNKVLNLDKYNFNGSFSYELKE